MLPLILTALVAAAGIGLKNLGIKRTVDTYPLETLIELPKKVTTHDELIAHYQRTFTRKISVVEQEIRLAARIDKETWEKEKISANQRQSQLRAFNKEIAHKYHASKAYTYLDQRIVKIIEEVLADCGIDKDEIHIVEDSETAASESIIFVNFNYEKPIPEDELRFVIAHEAQHIKNHDGWGIEKLLASHANWSPNEGRLLVKPSALDLLYHKYKKLCETRADVLAALINPAYTTSYYTWTRIESAELVTSGDFLHPTLLQRLRLSKILLHQMRQLFRMCEPTEPRYPLLTNWKRYGAGTYHALRQRLCGPRPQDNGVFVTKDSIRVVWDDKTPADKKSD